MPNIAYYSSVIDPKIPFHMEGYEDRIATSIHDHLYMNTIYIQQEKVFILHVLDIIMIPKELANRIKKESAKQFHLAEDEIMVTSIHTHSGPTVSNLLTRDVEVNQEYLDFLLASALENTRQCLSSSFEGKIFYGTMDIDDYFCNRNGKDLPYNKTAYLWKITDMQNNSRLTLVNMGCHPTVLKSNNLCISSDFVGEMREHYKELTGTPLVFMNAEGGDVSTRILREGTDFNEVARVGKGIAKYLVKAKFTKEIHLKNSVISSYTLDINYDPKQDDWLCEHLMKFEHELAALPEHTKQRGDLKFMFYNNLRRIYDQEYIELHPTCWVVEFDDFRFVSIPGELVYEFGRRMRSVDDKAMFIITYANDFNIYAVNKEQYGAYFESFNSNYPYGKADEMIANTISLYKNTSDN